MSMARHGPNELIATIASAPAAWACSAARRISRPSGLSFTKTGTSTAAFAARMAAIIGAGVLADVVGGELERVRERADARREVGDVLGACSPCSR